MRSHAISTHSSQTCSGRSGGLAGTIGFKHPPAQAGEEEIKSNCVKVTVGNDLEESIKL